MNKLHVIFCFLFSISYGQITITSIILDSNKKPIPSSSLILKEISGKILKYVRNDELEIYDLKLDLLEKKL